MGGQNLQCNSDIFFHFLKTFNLEAPESKLIVNLNLKTSFMSICSQKKKKIGIVKRLCLIIIISTTLDIFIPDVPGNLNNYNGW